MFRGSASLAIPHLKSFAAIPSASLVQLGHTNRNVLLSHESQNEIALVEALSRLIPYCQQGEMGERHGPVFRKVCVFDVSRAIGIARFESVSGVGQQTEKKGVPRWWCILFFPLPYIGEAAMKTLLKLPFSLLGARKGIPKSSSSQVFLEKLQGAARLGATGLRASEREICL